jgi:hypothetical protein
MGALVLDLLLKAVTSNFVKFMIAKGVNHLLTHSKDGITKDIAVTVLDGVAMSKANDVPSDAFEFVKNEYLK